MNNAKQQPTSIIDLAACDCGTYARLDHGGLCPECRAALAAPRVPRDMRPTARPAALEPLHELDDLIAARQELDRAHIDAHAQSFAIDAAEPWQQPAPLRPAALRVLRAALVPA